MTQQFNVGDTVKYTSPFNSDGLTGVIVEVNGKYRKGYLVRWAAAYSVWIADGNLSLVTTEVTIQSAKELKVAMEVEILRLIGDFNKKTNLEVKGVDLVYYKDTRGYYQVNVKVEI